MVFRFRRSIKLAPGIRFNLSKSGGSISLGPRGAKITLGPRGVRKTIGIPGTGLHWTEHTSWSKTTNRRTSEPSTSAAQRVTITNADELERYINSGAVLINPDTGRKFTSAQLGKKLREFREQERRQEGQAAIDAELKELAALTGLANQLPALRDENHWKNELEIRPFVEPQFEEEPVPDVGHFIAKARKGGSRLRFLWIPFVAAMLLLGAAILVPYVYSMQEKELASLMLLGGIGFIILPSVLILKLQRKWTVSTEVQGKAEWEKASAAYESALAEHEASAKEAERQWTESERDRIEIVRALIEGCPDTMEDVIEEVLQELEFPYDVHANFQVLNSGHIALDVDLPEIENVVPLDEPKLLKNGNVQRKSRTKAQINSDYARIVIGLAFYFAHQIFESCPTAQNVLVSAYTQRLSRKTGNIEDQYVCSVVFDRKLFSGLRFAQIDPVEAIQNFTHVIKLSGGMQLGVIDPIPIGEFASD